MNTDNNTLVYHCMYRISVLSLIHTFSPQCSLVSFFSFSFLVVHFRIGVNDLNGCTWHHDAFLVLLSLAVYSSFVLIQQEL